MLKLQIVAALLLAALFAASCGGSSQGLSNTDLDLDKGFNALRVNSDGQSDPTLSDTVSMEVDSRGGRTYVRVAIDDRTPMRDVLVHLEFDESRYNPVSSEFSGLVENCLELAITDFAGIVPLCQSSFDDPMPRRGQFAEVVFENRPMTQVRRASATHTTLLNVSYFPDPPKISTPKGGFEVTKTIAEDGAPATFTIYSLFATGDGDDNKETNLADISALVAQGNFYVSVSDSNFGPASTDYDRNGEANIADISEIAKQYSNTYTDVEILLGNSPTLGDADLFKTVSYESGNESQHLGDPFTTTDWAAVFRTWNESVTVDEMILVDSDEDGTVYVSARAKDLEGSGVAFPGVALAYETGPPVITAIDLDFPDSATYVQDPPGSGNYLVIITENSVDEINGNNEPFAPESIGLVASLTVEGEVDPIQDNSLVLWYVVDGAGLGAVSNSSEKGKVTFINRGLVTIQAQAPGNFNINSQITFKLCSIDSITLDLQAGGGGPADVNSGDTVQLLATGTFDWDSVDNSNEIDLDITSACSWASLADPTNTGSFVINSGTGAVNTNSADSGDSVRITCEFPGSDIITLYDNQKRTSNFFRVNIN